MRGGGGRWYLLGALYACALGGEAIWGAVKFHGAWHLAYGAVAVVAFALAAAIWRGRQCANRKINRV